MISKEIIKKAGGGALVGRICKVTQGAVSGWVSRGSLPRTEWTGETSYAEYISKQAKLLGHDVDPSLICPDAMQYMQRSKYEGVES